MIYTSPYTHKVRKGSVIAAKKVRFKFHVVSHTHWDREWYPARFVRRMLRRRARD